ncbi:photoperiod responsive protein, partial [Genlisea aurea]
KRREELQVAVPAPFRCPISMDVMKSPVSLCTGITYDRSSIEKWLALGNTTCPATMITLSSTRTIPNLTLRRLIHLWLSQNDSFRSPPAVCEPQLAEIFAGELDSESLSKVVGFVKESPEENSAFFGESNDAVCKLISFFAARSDEVEIGEQVVEVLVLISKENGVIERLNRLISSGGVGDPLPALARVLRKGTTESKLNAARILNQIAINVESRRKISETPTVLHE